MSEYVSEVEEKLSVLLEIVAGNRGHYYCVLCLPGLENNTKIWIFRYPDHIETSETSDRVNYITKDFPLFSEKSIYKYPLPIFLRQHLEKHWYDITPVYYFY